MLALAIDTSTDIAGLALATEDKLISELSFRHKMDLLQRLMPNVDRLISDAGMKQSDLDALVVSLGPGSFTGLRIGMAAAKSIAHVLGKPIIGVPTMDVLAESAAAACPKSIVTAIHARPGDVFWSLFRCEAGKLAKVVEDEASTVEEMLERACQEDQVVFCGDGVERNRAIIEQKCGPDSILPQWYHFPRASVLVSLGIRRLLRGESDDLFSLTPRYVRKPTPVIRLETGKYN
ncbi:MAG TPA: tRNA (adenosine(37)-N6)-threonylcarbamoyltransferase complex dimerization subunit type 1 TsaB [Armatimonadota bacterium]|nr:tRNA (adenosine(37)-N6)-threonylcarbamoyltransferase complex dimerization subunit type 1 TsaB [Armatimonadota bacterium]